MSELRTAFTEFIMMIKAAMIEKRGDTSQNSSTGFRTDRAGCDKEGERPGPEVEEGASRGQPYQDQQLQQRGFIPHIELLVFDGNKASEWLERCNFYFNYYQTAEVYNVGLATMNFTGDAEEWYSCYRVEHPHHTWLALVNAIFEGFKLRCHLNPVVQFKRVHQTGTVDDYIRDFQRAKSRLLVEIGITQEYFFVWSFISGLRDEIQNSMNLFKPQTLSEAFNLALELEVVVRPTDKKPLFFKPQGHTSYKPPYNPNFNPLRQIELPPMKTTDSPNQNSQLYKPPHKNMTN